MKFAIALLGLLAATARAQQENPYDVLGKALMPIFHVFVFSGDPAPGPGHALVLDAHLIAASKLPPELQGQAVHIAVSAPNNALVQAPISGQMLTVCRDGDSLWAAPGSQLQGFIDSANAASPAPSPGKKKKDKSGEILGPLVLPIPEKELVFLPILFQVADGGSDTVAAQPCRVLNVQLMPQLAKSLHAENWSAKMWVGANYGIVQLELTGPDWSGTASIDKLEFPDTLPDSTFQAPNDSVKLTPQQFLNLLQEAGRQ
jgi:hypothetical protein